MPKCSMQKRIESFSKKNESEWVHNVRERLWSLIDNEFFTYADLGEYLMKALSEDTLQNVYGWLKQDEMIPSEDKLADEYQLEFNDNGELVSTEEE